MSSMLLLTVSFAATSLPDPVALVRTGDDLPGVGAVVGIESVQLTSYGSWHIVVTTDNPTVDTVMLLDGQVVRKVGDPSAGLGGASIAGFDAWSYDVLGLDVWNARLENTGGGATDDEAVFYGNGLQIQKGVPVCINPTDVLCDTVWTSFDDVQSSGGQVRYLLRGTASGPIVNGDLMAVVSHAGSPGAIALVDPVAHEGMSVPLPGAALRIERLRAGPWAARAGKITADLALWSADLTGPADRDGAVFRTATAGGQQFPTLLAREGSPSPVAGRDWGPLDDPVLDVNIRGDWTMVAELDGSDPATDAIIVRNGRAFVREGDTHPAIDPLTFADFGRGRAALDDVGRVLWYARWDDPAAHGSTEALFFQSRLVVRPGVTTVGGIPLASIEAGPYGYALSPDGRMAIFHGRLRDGRAGAFLIDLDS